jgi:hypothetical protein
MCNHLVTSPSNRFQKWIGGKLSWINYKLFESEYLTKINVKLHQTRMSAFIKVLETIQSSLHSKDLLDMFNLAMSLLGIKLNKPVQKKAKGPTLMKGPKKRNMPDPYGPNFLNDTIRDVDKMIEQHEIQTQHNKEEKLE